MAAPGVPLEVRALTPLADAAGAALLRHVREHADAPRWTHTLGDRLLLEDLSFVHAFRRTLGPVLTHPSGLPLGRWRETIPWVRTHAPALALDGADFAALPLQRRADIANHLDVLVPLDAELARMIHYETTGTTSTPLTLPAHPRATAMNHLLYEEALARNAVTLTHGPTLLVAHVCAQVTTWTFPALLSYWGNGAMVKVNLNPADWSPPRARAFLTDLAPQVLTGDPVSFAELLAWDVSLAPRALVSGATTLAPALAAALSARYGCPVVDVYSLTEVGPVAATTPDGMRLLCPDLYVEIVEPDGRPVPDGERGEIVVSGGRNPYLPLVRYATGDYARKHGEYLYDLQARTPASWRAADGTVVTPIDLSRILNPYTFAASSFGTEAGGLVLRARPVEGEPFNAEPLAERLSALFGRPVAVEVDPTLGGEKKAAEWRE
jgi:phenylacetate-CoA ligase